MSLLYVSDIHVWHKTPRSRLDNYLQSSLLMLEKVGKLALNLDVDAVIFGGDVGHDTDWPISLFHDVRDVLSSYTVPIYTAVGNHDMDNYNLNTVYRSGLGALEVSKTLNIPRKPVEIGKDWRVTFFHAGQQDTKDLIDGKYTPHYPSDCRIEVAVAHAPIGPAEAPLLSIPFYNILCLADIHIKMDPIKKGHCTILNPGPLERRSIAEKDEGGFVALLSVNQMKKVEISYIDLEAPPASEVFIQKAEDQLSEILGEGIIKIMNDIKLNPQVSTKDYITKIARELKVPSSVLDLVLGELSSG